MARNIANASNQYLQYSGAIVTALPITLAAWLRPTSFLLGGIVSLNTSGSNNHRLTIAQDTNGLAFAASRDTAFAASYTATSLSTGTWHHVAGVYASTTSRTAYKDGVAGTTDTASNSPSGWGLATIGRSNSAVGQYLNGDVAEVGIWSVALTTADIAQLAAGFSPLFVRPDALVAYVPLMGRDSPEIELIGRQDFALTNAPTNTSHPRVLRPSFVDLQFSGPKARPVPILARGTRLGMEHRVTRVAMS